MKISSAALCVSVFATLGAWSAAAQAVTITYDFTATVSTLYEYDKATSQVTPVTSSSFTGTTVSVNEVLTGSFTYNTDWALSTYPLTPAPTVGTWKLYVAPSSVNAITYSAHGTTVYGASGYASVQVQNDAAFTYISARDTFYIGTVGAISSPYYQSAGISLQDPTQTVFQSDAIPQVLRLEDFQYAMLSSGWLRQSDGNQLLLNATLTSLTQVTAVPEAGTAPMLGLGLLALVVARQRRRNGASRGREGELTAPAHEGSS